MLIVPLVASYGNGNGIKLYLTREYESKDDATTAAVDDRDATPSHCVYNSWSQFCIAIGLRM